MIDTKLPLDKVNMMRLMLASLIKPNEGPSATSEEIVQLVEGLLKELHDDLEQQGDEFMKLQIRRATEQGGSAS